MSENPATAASTESNPQEVSIESIATSTLPSKEAPGPNKKRSFDTFYLFCVFLLALAIGTQIVAIAIYN
jgi:hypothetical protein